MSNDDAVNLLQNVLFVNCQNHTKTALPLRNNKNSTKREFYRKSGKKGS